MAGLRPAELEERLERFPRLELAHLPTPLERLERLGAQLAGPEIWVKRDDATGLALGGNKVRKLEYLLGQALAEGTDGVITVGGVQSNHARQTAAAAARHGLECHLVLLRVVPRDSVEYEHNGNMLLDHLFGANVHVVDDDTAAASTIAGLLEDANVRGRKFVVHPAGGSTPTGCLGYVRAIAELCHQVEEHGVDFSRIYVAIGSGGTLAGLLCGAAAMRLSSEIRGVCVLKSAVDQVAEVEKLATETADLIGTPSPSIDPSALEGGHLGEGYGVPTEKGLEAIQLCARSEGLLLDPVYTSKAMGCLVADIRSGSVSADRPVLFWHTGGAPGLFGYREELTV